MNFKTKDLLVTVLPKVTDAVIECLFRSIICRYPTFQNCEHRSLCRAFTAICGICSIRLSCILGTCNPPTYVEPDPFVIRYTEDLLALRAELQDTLKQLDTIQKEGLPSSIGSKAEADALEQSLNEALRQVKAAQAKFRRG